MMSEKGERYIGLSFWIMIIIVFWVLDFGNLIDVNLKIDFSDSLIHQFSQKLARWFGYSHRDSDVLGWIIWWFSIIASLWGSWKYRASPMRLIKKFNKSV